MPEIEIDTGPLYECVEGCNIIGVHTFPLPILEEHSRKHGHEFRQVA